MIFSVGRVVSWDRLYILLGTFDLIECLERNFGFFALIRHRKFLISLLFHYENPKKTLNVLTAFSRCRHILKTVKNVTVVRFGLAFTRCWNNLKTVRNLMVKNSFTPRIDQSRSKSIEKYFLFFIVFEFSHDAVSKMCRLEFRFQNLPFSKSAAKNVPFSCEREAYPSYFRRFQNVSVSCERILQR